MNRRGFFALVAAATLTFGSCATDDNAVDLDYDDVELLVLSEIMASFYPDAYYQVDGFYVEPIDMSAKEGIPTNGGEGYWIRYDILSTKLNGDICNTRNATMAKQQGTFNYYTRYAPALQILSNVEYDDYDAIDDAGFDPMTDLLTVDAIDYMCQNSNITLGGEVTNIYAGNEFKLFVPSALQGYYANGTGGYAGQNSISTTETMISTIKITEVIADIEETEISDIDLFIANNTDDTNAWTAVTKYLEYEEDEEYYFEYEDDVDEDEYYLCQCGHEAFEVGDHLHVFVNQGYEPSTVYNFTNPYNYQYLEDYDLTSFADADARFTYVDDLITAALESLVVDEDENYTEDTFELSTDEEDDIIDPETSASIWYVLRTLDGFVVDTNIMEVKEIVYGDDTMGSAISYNPSSSSYSYVAAWYAGLIELKYGQWASILTKSTYAYGALGQTGSSASTEIQPHTPLLFNIFIQKAAI